jgi:NADH-quinone oxidoreductase subunit F
MTTKINTIEDLERIQKQYNDETAKYAHQVLVCAGAGCVSSNCGDVRDAVVQEIQSIGKQGEVIVRETGCMGTCAVGP